jgi:hypothetical protein
MDYDELVKFVEWMGKNAHHKPYVWIERTDDEVASDGKEEIDFDGVFNRDDVQRFNQVQENP